MQIRLLILLCSLMLVQASCSPQPESNGSDKEQEKVLPPERACGAPMLVSVRGESGPSLGVLEVLNDTHMVWISFTHTQRYVLREARVFLGRASEIPLRESGLPDADKFGLVINEEDSTGRCYHHVRLEELPECMSIAVRVELEDLEAGESKKVVRGWAFGRRGPNRFTLEYCVRPCIVIDQCGSAEAGDFVSLALEDWKEDSGKWETMLKDDFQSLFPEGLQLGCDLGLHFHNSQSVLDLLKGPGGEAAALQSNVVDPAAGSVQNDLAQQLCALTIVMELDRRRPDFSKSRELFSSLEVATGPFEGWKVDELAQEAAAILGACASNYSASQMSNVLVQANGSFRKGKLASGFLRCP